MSADETQVEVTCADTFTWVREEFLGDEEQQQPSVDVLVLDPIFDAWPRLLREFPFEQVVRKQGGVIACFTKKPWTGRVQVGLEERGWRLLTDLVWEFGVGRWESHRLPLPRHQTILFFTRQRRNPLCDMRFVEWVQRPTRCNKARLSLGRDPHRPRRTYTPGEHAHLESVVHFPKNLRRGAIYKPQPLMDLVLRMSNVGPGKVVLDPFCGLGSSAESARRLRAARWIGCDVDADASPPSPRRRSARRRDSTDVG